MTLIPDPRDRSKNDPAVLLSKSKVLKLAKMYLGKSFEKSDIQKMIIDKATQMGWGEVRFTGMQAILIAKFA